MLDAFNALLTALLRYVTLGREDDLAVTRLQMEAEFALFVKIDLYISTLHPASFPCGHQHFFAKGG